MGTGFAKLREYGLNERLKSRERIHCESNRKYLEAGRWRDMALLLGAHDTPSQPVYGWTNGIRWSLDYAEQLFRADVINEQWGPKETAVIATGRSQKGSHSGYFVDVGATSDDAVVILYMHLDRILDDVHKMTIERGKMDYWIGRFLEAKAQLDADRDKFPAWERSLGTEARNDPMMTMLRDRYRGEHEAMLEKHHTTILEGIMKVCVMHGARYVSISQQDFIIFEDIRTTRAPFGKPMAWHLADVLDIGGGCCNGSQAQVSLHNHLGKGQAGTYDLTGDTPIRIGKHVPLRDAHMRHIEAIYTGDQSINDWLQDCGATGRDGYI